MFDTNMKDMTVTGLCDLTASNSPAPGGGSISAMAGAYSAALCAMVAKLTTNKKGYEHLNEQMAQINQQAEALRLELLTDIQKDSESFNAYMEALGLPKNTDEEKAARSQAMQDALKGACQVPLKVAYKCLEALKMAKTAVELGNINTASDGMVGALLGRASVLGATHNVRINLGGIKDEDFKADMMSQCDQLEAQANAIEQEASRILHER